MSTVALHDGSPALFPAGEVPFADLHGLFGVGVVAAHDVAARYAGMRPGPPDMVGRGDFVPTSEIARRKLDAARMAMADLPEQDASRFAPYVKSLVGDQLPDDLRRLGGRAFMARFTSQDPEVLLSFLRQNVAAVLQLETDMQPFNEHAKRYVAHKIEELVRTGYFSLDSQKVLSEIGETQVKIGDWWSTRRRGHYGYHYIGTNYIVVSQGLGKNRYERATNYALNADETIVHELSHKLFDKTFPDYLEDDSHWLSEAFAEHFTSVLALGRPDTIHPGDRPGDQGVYSEYRELIAEIMHGLPTGLWTRAMTSSGPNRREWKRLNQALSDKYGADDILLSVTTAIKRRTQVLLRKKGYIAGVEPHAAREVLGLLRQSPEVIIGAPRKYQNPRHVGAAGLALAR